MIKSQLENLDLTGKHVLLRADLNVPLKGEEIIDDYRLENILPTINMILEKKGNIILLSHLGRPTNHEPELSTKQLIKWFKKKGYNIAFAPTIEDAALETKKNPIVLLENLRFFPGERNQDPEFAKKLAALGDYYINDAFATMHRNESSITQVPHHFSKNKKSLGLFAELELNRLDSMLKPPAKPFALLVGGGKIETKILLINELIEKIDMLFLCPAIVFTFLKAQGKSVGKSLVNNKAIDVCKEILKKAQKNNVSVYFPIDYQIAMNSFDGPLSYVPGNEIPDNGVGINIGPQTIDLFENELKKAKTILYNGLMGDLKRKDTIENSCNLFNVIAQTEAQTIIAGGDSVAAAHICNVNNIIDWCSSGGGATIAYLRNKTLPGLQAFE